MVIFAILWTGGAFDSKLHIRTHFVHIYFIKKIEMNISAISSKDLSF